MKEKKIIITLTKDIDISEAVSKALNPNDKKQHKTLQFSKKQENGILEGKLVSVIGEFRSIAG
jgi:hypothetical protein